MKLIFRLLMFLVLLPESHADTKATAQVRVEGGIYAPFFRDKDEIDQEIKALLVDKYPVTNQQYLEFVKSETKWRKSKIKSLFAGDGYLEHWSGDLTFPSEERLRPVTNISWFAARQFCEKQDKRLPTIAEWEYLSDAQNPENLDMILNWYAETSKPLGTVTEAKLNSKGLVGMHGLIWEWAEDFSSVIMAGDSRSTNETSKTMFCGSGSLNAKDAKQYATFMRFAHRSSLKAASIGRNLGFRCVQDL